MNWHQSATDAQVAWLFQAQQAYKELTPEQRQVFKRWAATIDTQTQRPTEQGQWPNDGFFTRGSQLDR